MRNTIIILFIATFIISACSRTVQKEDVEVRDGLVYKKNSEEPFNGIIRDYYANDEKKSQFKYKDGILEGEFIIWYKSGKIKSKGSYHNGQQIGLWQVWYENGQLASKGEYNDEGLKTGHWTFWYDDGSKKSEGKYEKGYKLGKWQYYSKEQKEEEKAKEKDSNVRIDTIITEDDSIKKKIIIKRGAK